MGNNPDYTRKLFNDAQIDEYVSQHCPGPYSAVFHSINPALGAMKADLWRYCVLYREGGVYFDVDDFVSNKPLSEWIDHNVVLSMEGNSWDSVYNKCTNIWSAVNETFPSQIIVPNQLAQWAMIFPLRSHPILKEAMDIVIGLLTSWDDGTDKRWETKWRVLCLSGPAVFSVAAHNVFMAARGEWQDIYASLDGIDYEKKLSYKSPVSGELLKSTEKKYYQDLSIETPIKVIEASAVK